MNRTGLLACATVLLLASGCAEPADPPSTRVARFDTIARISFVGLPSPSASSPVAVNADHSLVAVALRDGSGEILVFNREGELARQIGRRGDGPGEFREISLITFDADSDSLWVFDHENGRITIVPPDTSPSRSIALPGRFFAAAWAADTTLMVNGNFADGGPSNALVRAVHPEYIRPVTLEETVLVGDGFTDLMRPMTSARIGGIWAAHFREPRLRRVDAHGSVLEDISYDAPALEVVPANADAWAGLIDTRPAVSGLTEDAEGGVWVLFGVPADPLPAVDDPGRAMAAGEVGIDDISRTVLARYDGGSLESGPAQEFTQGAIRGGLLPGGIMYYFDPDSVGELKLTVVRLGSR